MYTDNSFTLTSRTGPPPDIPNTNSQLSCPTWLSCWKRHARYLVRKERLIYLAPRKPSGKQPSAVSPFKNWFSWTESSLLRPFPPPRAAHVKSLVEWGRKGPALSPYMGITVKVYPASEELAEIFCWDYIPRQLFSLPNSASFVYLPGMVLHLRACFQWSTICGNWYQVWPNKTDTKIRCWSYIPPYPAGSEDTVTGLGKLSLWHEMGAISKTFPTDELGWCSVGGEATSCLM